MKLITCYEELSFLPVEMVDSSFDFSFIHLAWLLLNYSYLLRQHNWTAPINHRKSVTVIDLLACLHSKKKSRLTQTFISLSRGGWDEKEQSVNRNFVPECPECWIQRLVKSQQTKNTHTIIRCGFYLDKPFMTLFHQVELFFSNYTVSEQAAPYTLKGLWNNMASPACFPHKGDFLIGSLEMWRMNECSNFEAIVCLSFNSCEGLSSKSELSSFP